MRHPFAMNLPARRLLGGLISDQPIAEQSQRRVKAALRAGIDVVATNHSWGWSRWRIGPASVVTREAMYVKEPGLTGARLQAAAALAHPDLVIDLNRSQRVSVTPLTPVATVIAAGIWLASMSLGGSLPWILLPLLAVLVMISCSRTVLGAVVGPRLRIVNTGSADFDHLNSAAEILDGIDDVARRRLQIDTHAALWSAAGTVRPCAAEELAVRAASLALAAARADELAEGHEISEQTWIRLTGPSLDQGSNSPHHDRLCSIAEQLRLLDRVAAAEAGLATDQILAEAASSHEAAEQLDDALRIAIHDTRTTHHAEAVVDQLIEDIPAVPDLAVQDLPTFQLACAQIDAYRGGLTDRVAMADAAIAALQPVDPTSPPELTENI